MLFNLCGKRRVNGKKQTCVVQCSSDDTNALNEMKKLFTALKAITPVSGEDWDYREYVMGSVIENITETWVFKGLFTFELLEPTSGSPKSISFTMDLVSESTLESVVDLYLSNWMGDNTLTHEDIIITSAIFIPM